MAHDKKLEKPEKRLIMERKVLLSECAILSFDVWYV